MVSTCDVFFSGIRLKSFPEFLLGSKIFTHKLMLELFGVPKVCPSNHDATYSHKVFQNGTMYVHVYVEVNWFLAVETQW